MQECLIVKAKSSDRTRAMVVWPDADEAGSNPLQDARFWQTSAGADRQLWVQAV